MGAKQLIRWGLGTFAYDTPTLVGNDGKWTIRQDEDTFVLYGHDGAEINRYQNITDAMGFAAFQTWLNRA